MKNIYFTLGPSKLFSGVDKDINQALKEEIASSFHRSPKIQNIFKETIEGLKQLLNIPSDYQIFFLSSATECMERILQNCVKENSFHFVNGAFSDRFYQTAKELGKTPKCIEVEPGSSFDFKNIKIPAKTELVCFTQNETSSGVAIDPKDIGQFKKRYPSMLTAVDIVSSAPVVDLDYSLLDLAFFSIQKGFGLPAGMAVLIVSPAAITKAKKLESQGLSIGSYHNFINLEEYSQVYQTIETPNVLAIYLLNKVVKKMLAIGIEKIRAQTLEKAKTIYDFFEQKKGFKSFVRDKNSRSQTIIIIETEGNSLEIVDQLREQGIFINSGYKEFKQHQIRIANFPAHSLANVKRLLKNLSSY